MRIAYFCGLGKRKISGQGQESGRKPHAGRKAGTREKGSREQAEKRQDGDEVAGIGVTDHLTEKEMKGKHRQQSEDR